MVWSPDSTRLASRSEDETIRIWDVKSGTTLHTILKLAKKVEHMAWSPDGKMLAAVVGNIIRIWDTQSGNLQKTLVADRHHLPQFNVTLSWTADSKTIVSGRGNGTIIIWDVASGKQLATLLDLHDGVGIAFTPDGNFKGPADCQRELVYVVETETGQETLTPEKFFERFNRKNVPEAVKLRP
jgi:WD40 repeat protein